MFYPNSESWICHDLILQIISYQIKDYTHDHGSIGLFLGNNVFWRGIWLWVFWPFPFLFLSSARQKKSPTHKIFGRQPKGEDHFRSWFSFFPYLVVKILYCLDICLVLRPFCRFLLFSSDLWSGSFFLFFSFCSLPIFDREFSFAFFQSLIRNFLFFPFSSFKGKDGHSHPGSRFMVSWNFGLRLVERLDMIYVRVLVWPTVQG